MARKTIEQTPWVPTQEWLKWAETFDARIGFRPEDRGEEEEAARARAEVDVRHRGDSGHGDGTDPVWTVSSDRPTVTPRRSGTRALHRWMHDGEARRDEAMDAIALRPVVRHPNRARVVTDQERADAAAEAEEIRRVLHEYRHAG